MLTSHMKTQRSMATLVFGWFLFILMISVITHAKSSNMTMAMSWCIPKERQALLEFRQSIIDYFNVLSSWSSRNESCCQWTGVTCEDNTGHVIGLNLSSWRFRQLREAKYLGGKIDILSLLELRHLSLLDLSFNNFDGYEIPSSIGALAQLKELSLSTAGFSGRIPPQLGNLSNLLSLDLSRNYYLQPISNLDWLSGLSSLRSLDLSGLNLSQVISWPMSISKLPSLLELHLKWCGLPDVNPTSLYQLIPPKNVSKSLKVLDLSGNSFNASIFHWIASIGTNLVELRSRGCGLQGHILDVVANMVSLELIDLSSNQLQGGIPKSFRNLCVLESLDLQDNKFSDRLEDSVENLSGSRDTLMYLSLGSNPFWGPLPNLSRYSSLINLKIDHANLSGAVISSNLDQLSKLEILSLGSNRLSGPLPIFTGLSSLLSLNLGENLLNGVVTETHFSIFSRLIDLDISRNHIITLNLSSNWIPPFQLLRLVISSCMVGPAFPKWLQTQRKLEQLFIAEANISESIPEWFWNQSSSIQYLNLSFNQIRGKLPDLSSYPYLIIEMTSNQLSGPLPPFHPDTMSLALPQNMFSGPITSLCEMPHSSLIFLDLSYNKLSGVLPDCWMKFKSLDALNMPHNNFSGELPNSLGYLLNLGSLNLRGNNFSGEMPSLQNCERLALLDLGRNKISGKLPKWLGTSGKSLVFLSLHSNEFYGSIPTSWCSLRALRTLDLSRNNLSGVLPRCFAYLTSMASDTTVITSFHVDTIIDLVSLTWKGTEHGFGTIFGLLRIIDISSNHLSGEIPESISSLLKLNSLNLSNNDLTGRIPDNIGQLTNLESLDLSRNQLSGMIPSSFSALHFLQNLNLSYNKLTGKIPTGPQMHTFEASSYIGNPGLYGLPLTTENQTVHGPASSNHAHGNDDDDGYVSIGFYVSMGIGFVVGFWGFLGSLLYRSSWRHAYFRFWSNTSDWIYVTTMVFKARLMRRLASYGN